MEERLPATSAEQKREMLRLLTFLAVDLRSAVPEWVLLKSRPKPNVDAMADSVLRELQRTAEREPLAEQKLRDELRADAAARFKAEVS